MGSPVIFNLVLQSSLAFLLPDDCSAHRLISPWEGWGRLSSLHLLCELVVLLLSVREALTQSEKHKARPSLPWCCHAAFVLTAVRKGGLGGVQEIVHQCSLPADEGREGAWLQVGDSRVVGRFGCFASDSLGLCGP